MATKMLSTKFTIVISMTCARRFTSVLSSVGRLWKMVASLPWCGSADEEPEGGTEGNVPNSHSRNTGPGGFYIR